MVKNSFVKSKGLISVSVNVQIILFQEDGMWVAYCPALELSSYGDNQDDAKQSFEETMNIFLFETNRKGTLERYLLKLGWQLQQKPKLVYKQPSFSLQTSQKLLRKHPVLYKERVSIPVA